MALLQYLLLCLLLLVAVSEADSSLHSQEWICHPTALGRLDIAGGKVNKTLCGKTCASHSDPWIGYIGAVVAVLGFGSNFLPVKKFDTGDGLFFQWILCIGIWLVGLVVNIVRYQPPFYLPSLMGGFLWTTGNILCVPIIKMIGLTMGLTVWGSTNLIAGWISGRFIINQDLNCTKLNYGGVAAVLISTFILAFVKSEGKKIEEDRSAPTEEDPLINTSSSTSLSGSLRDRLVRGRGSSSTNNGTGGTLTFSPRKSILSGTEEPSHENEEDEDTSWVDKLGKWPRRIVGFCCSLGAGFLFGFQFLGVEYMRMCDDKLHSCNELDYVFGHFTGILLASTLWFVMYSTFRLNKPQVYPKVILPALASGIMWGIAMVGWFVANEHLSLAVSFPIITAGPGFVSSAWGILLFREIKGWKNIGLYFGAFSISLSGLVMVGLSSCNINC